MKPLILITLSLISLKSYSSNYPADYCHANVKICEQGAGIVAQVSSGCSSPSYIIGYKGKGLLANRRFVDAIVLLHFGWGNFVKKDFRIMSDWHNLGFLTSDFKVLNYGQLTDISIAYSDANGSWDSKNGANYHFPIGAYQAPGCYTVKTSEDFYNQVPLSAWSVITEALKK